MDYCYLDYAASAPRRAEADRARENYLCLPCAGANPNSLHSLGRMAASELSRAKKLVANCLEGYFRPQEIHFCGGGSLANYLAVVGLALGARQKQARKTSVLISALEHDSVLKLESSLKKLGFEVHSIRPNSQGFIDLDAAQEQINSLGPENIALASVMAANNETGVIQPIADLARLFHQHKISFHVDAIQAFGHIKLQLDFVDAVSMAGHKLGAGVSSACLALKTTTAYIRPLAVSGAQAEPMPGTPDVLGAVEFAAVAELCHKNLDQATQDIASMRDQLVNYLSEHDPKIRWSCEVPSELRLPNIVHILVGGCTSEDLILHLDARGYCVSAASACTSGAQESSHVLRAIGMSAQEANSALRVSFDERVSLEKLMGFANALLEVAAKLRKH